jgi:hypothetical protein
MSSPRLLLFTGLGVLFGAFACSWLWLVSPGPLSAYVIDPAHFALVAGTAVAPAYAALALLRHRREGLEKLLLAAFLAAMPAIYLWGALRNHEPNAMLVEFAGFAVYAGWALVGYRRSTLLLGLGIAAHGLGWDSWHHGHASYIESWYPSACLLVDVAFALAIAAHLHARRTVKSDRTRGCHGRYRRSPRLQGSNEPVGATALPLA